MAIKINKDIQISDTGVSLENLQKYSTSETKIGTWIDGKPLYRVIVEMPLTGTYSESGKVYTWKTYRVTNLKDICYMSATLKGIDRILDTRANTVDLALVYLYTTSGQHPQSFQLGVNGSLYYTGTMAYIDFRYTKTTD